MANTINWGEIYCYSHWGDDKNKASVPEFPEFCTTEQGSCGVQYSYTGGETFPSIFNVNLGAGTGIVTLNFNAKNVPDKFEVWFDGIKVIDTGYRGSATYQTDLDNALALRGLPSETIAGVGLGTANFNKTTNTEVALVKVYAPIEGTSWDLTLACPV
jgi:hypothetical protein